MEIGSRNRSQNRRNDNPRIQGRGLPIALTGRSHPMVTVGLLVRLEAKPGKEAEAARFPEGGLALASEEPDTTAWFAIRLGPSSYGIFDVFPSDAGRQAPLRGRVAEA